MLLLYIVAPEGHVSPETEQVSSPGSASSTHLEEHDDEDYDDDDDDDDDDAAIDTQIQASDHEEVPIETVLPPNRPANTTYDAIVASEGKIVEAENRRHSDLMTVLERMIALQEETVSQLAHLHRVFIEVPKQLQKINTSFEALVVQQTQANYLRMTNVPQFNFNTSQAGSVHADDIAIFASSTEDPQQQTGELTKSSKKVSRHMNLSTPNMPCEELPGCPSKDHADSLTWCKPPERLPLRNGEESYRDGNQMQQKRKNSPRSRVTRCFWQNLPIVEALPNRSAAH
ncbi:uncharacterized protein LOC142492386 [Ascaphus truei]|uniref:uncharacterized protein LOC142492386 n=1 Tax=Ascaphus truei TaxID=8439 RepID=UPI003F5994FA